MIVEGRVWKVGDNVGATDIVPERYDKEGMSGKWQECAAHVLEDLNPAIARRVGPGDLLVGGHNLGSGHAHYYLTAIKGSAAAGFSAFLGDSVGALFSRVSIDAGFPALGFPGISELVDDGDLLRIDLRTGHARNVTTGSAKAFRPVSGIIIQIIEAGGSRDWALRRVQQAQQANGTR